MNSPTPGIECLRELGRGSTSSVELARLVAAYGEWPADTLVAVKRLLPAFADDETALQALEDEARVAGEVNDPALVRALFASEDERGPFVVLEYVSGEDLRTLLLRERFLPEPRVRTIAAEIAGALAALHRAGRVHGDLKPENIRLDAKNRAVLVDLGFARRATEETKTTAGTLAYLAPEALRGGRVGPGADVFALGVMTYELATGEHPLLSGYTGVAKGSAARSVDAEDLFARLQDGRLDPPSRYAPEISPFFDQLVAVVLAPEADSRPSAADLARELRAGETGRFWRDRVERAEHGNFPRPPAPPRIPLVGRQLELVRLGEAFTVLHQRGDPGGPSGGVVWLSGPSGSGKSRLVNEFATRVRTSMRPPLFLYARASARREASPLGTLLHLLRRWLALPADHPPGERERELIERTLPPREAEVLLAALLRSGTELPPLAGAAFVSWLASLTRDRPVVVFVDDVHTAGEGTLAVLALLARELLTSEGLLVIGMRSDEPVARTEAVDNLRARLREYAVRSRPLPFYELELGPLDGAAVLELVEARFHPGEPRLRLARVLYERSLGNPGLLAEILNGLVEDDHVVPFAVRAKNEDSRWALRIPPDEIPFPGSLARAIEERYSRLDPLEKQWLARLSVLGGTFDSAFLARVFADEDERAIGALLLRLGKSGWLARISGRFRFARPALREGIYSTLPAPERTDLHARISDSLEAAAGNAGWDVVHQRAFHLRNAGRHRELIALVAPLLPEMPGIGQPERAFRLAGWGIEACERAGDVPPKQMLDFLETAADAANRLGRRRAEREVLDRMVELDLDLQAEPALAARVYLAHGRYAQGRGEFGLARGWLKNAAELATLAGSREVAGDALRRLAAAHGLSGDLVAALAASDAALDVAPDPRRRAFAALARAQTLVLENRVDEALAALALARSELTAVEENTVIGALAAIDMLRARIFRSTGRQGRALGAAKRAVRRARLAGDRRLEVEASARLGGLLIDLDRLDEAESHLRDALHIAQETEDRAGAVLAQMWLGILLWERNDEGAHAAIARAVELAEEIGHRRVVSLALAVHARLSLAAGRSDEALEESGRAQDLLERLGAELTDRIVITGTRVLVLQATAPGSPGAGNAARARELLRDLRRRIREGYRAIADESLRRSQRGYAERLSSAVLSPEGPLYPRTPLPD